MKRIVILLFLVVAAAAVSVFVNWDDWFGDGGGPSSSMSEKEKPSLPGVRMKRIPVADAARASLDRNLDANAATALSTLAVEGGMDLAKIRSIGIEKKVLLEDLTVLAGVGVITEDDVAKLADSEDSDVPASEVSNVKTDRKVPLSAIKALAKDGRIPARWADPIAVLADSGVLPTMDMKLDTEAKIVTFATDEVEYQEDGRWAAVHAIEITDDTGKIRVERGPSNQGWVLPEHQGIAVTRQRMKQVAQALDGLGEADLRSRSSRKQGEFEVAGDTGKTIRLEAAGNREIVALRIGKPAPASATSPRKQATWLRKIGSDAVFKHQQRMSSLINVMPRIWMDSRFFGIEYQDAQEIAKNVRKLRLEFDDVKMGPNQPVPGQRDPTGERVRVIVEGAPAKEDESAAPGPAPRQPGDAAGPNLDWTVAEPETATATEVHAPQIQRLISGLLNGRFEGVDSRNPDDEKYGFDKPVLQLEATLEDGKVYAITVGNQSPLAEDAPEGQARSRYAKLSGSPYIVTISEYTVAGMQKVPEDLEDPSKKAAEANPAGVPGMPPAGPPRILTPEEAAERDRQLAEQRKKDEALKESEAKKNEVPTPDPKKVEAPEPDPDKGG